MEPQLNDTAIVLKISQHIGNFPAKISQIQIGVKKARQTDTTLASIAQYELLQRMINSNVKLIQWQFLNMMQQVLRKIEPQIKNYPQHKSIKYLQSIIYEHLDPQIFSSVRISKIRKQLLESNKQYQKLNIADRLFAQLMTIMSQLLQTMKQYYGLPKDDKIQGILFEVINLFVSENQSCFLVLQDKKSSEEQVKKSNLRRQDDKKLNLKKQQDKKQKSSQGSSAMRTAQTLIGNLYAQIRKVNPLSSIKKLQQRQNQQRKQILFSQMQKIKKRESLNQISIKTVQRLLNMSSKQIIATMDKKQKEQFTAILYDSLESQVRKDNKKTKLSKIEHIQQQIFTLMQQTVDTDQFKFVDQFKDYRQLKWITLLFKSLQKEYHTDSERRKWLLKFCQNPYISKKLHNPFSVIKILQSENMQESNILKALRSLPLTQMMKLQNKQQVSNKKVLQAHLALEHEMNRIHLYQLKKKYAKQPNLEFQRLTDNKRRVITFLFSGFLSQDTCKVKQWSGLLNNFYDSQVYSVKWQSKTVKNMMEFAYKSVVDLGPTQSIAMLGGPYVKAFAILHNIYQKFQQNPFNPAFESAIATGQFMAEFIMNNFKGCFINLVGFSLGTQLIKNMLARMAQKNCLTMINKVYLIGGVADKNQIQKLIQGSPSSLTLINLYSDNDYILKYLLRVCKFNITPVGLNPIKQIEGHKIINQDCTYFIEGHMVYRDNLELISKLLKMADD